MKDTGTKREIKSFWWAPDHPETRWFGTLTLEAGHSPALELVIERPAVFDDLGALVPIIHGKDEHGGPITLLFVGSCGDTISGAVVKRTADAGYALLGIELSKADDFVAHSLCFKVQHLYGWLGQSGYDPNAMEMSGAYDVRYRQPQDQWFTITPDLELGVHAIYKTHGNFQERNIREDAALTFRSKAGFPLARCQELVRAARTLLHFASLKKVYPVWMTAYRDGHGYQLGDRWMKQGIEVYSSILREPLSESPLAHKWVFQFDTVRADFAGFMRKWLDYQETYDEPLGCYSSTIYQTLTSELTHLSLTQALEAYHGIRFSSHHKQEFQAKIEELSKLHATSLSGCVDDIAAFAQSVLCTRNYYTHHNPKWLAKGKVARGVDLIRMNEKLKLLFQMCVLTDMGIPADRFGRLRRQLATQIIEYT